MPKINLIITLIVLLGGALILQTSGQAKDYVYAPKGSEFKVTFPANPKIEVAKTATTTGEWATVTTAAWMLRAEYNVMSETSLKGAKNSTDDDLRDSMLEIARNNNYAKPTVTVSRTPLGRKVVMTGFTAIGGVTFRIEHQSYMGTRTIMGLIVMARPSVFQTRPIQNFYNSIELNPAYVREDTNYYYAPDGSEFKVTFPSKPTFRQVQMETGVEEEGTLMTGDSILRTEFGKLADKHFRAYQMASDSELRSGSFH